MDEGQVISRTLKGTKEKRLRQMIGELEKGGVYMNMAHPPSRKNKKGGEGQ
jgi:hypothetical protein